MTNEDKSPPDLAALGSRLRTVKESGEGRKRVGAAPEDKIARASGIGVGMRISIELVSAVAVGVGIGWLFDGWLGTTPWLMVLFLFLGFLAGMMNVYRVVKGLDDAVGLGRALREKSAASEERSRSGGEEPGSGESAS